VATSLAAAHVHHDQDPGEPGAGLGLLLLGAGVAGGLAWWWRSRRDDFVLAPDGTLLKGDGGADTWYLVAGGLARPVPAATFAEPVPVIVPALTIAAIVGPAVDALPAVVPVGPAGIAGMTRQAMQADPFARQVPSTGSTSVDASVAFYGAAQFAPVLDACNVEGTFLGSGRFAVQDPFVIAPPPGAARRMLRSIQANADLLGSSARLILPANVTAAGARISGSF